MTSPRKLGVEADNAKCKMQIARPELTPGARRSVKSHFALCILRFALFSPAWYVPPRIRTVSPQLATEAACWIVRKGWETEPEAASLPHGATTHELDKSVRFSSVSMQALLAARRSAARDRRRHARIEDERSLVPTASRLGITLLPRKNVSADRVSYATSAAVKGGPESNTETRPRGAPEIATRMGPITGRLKNKTAMPRVAHRTVRCGEIRLGDPREPKPYGRAGLYARSQPLQPNFRGFGKKFSARQFSSESSFSRRDMNGKACNSPICPHKCLKSEDVERGRAAIIRRCCRACPAVGGCSPGRRCWRE